MSYLSGVFEQFPDLDKVSLNNLKAWLPANIENHYLANILGNRILYPQTVPISKLELEIDLAILRQALKQKPAIVYEPQANKLYIPDSFLQRLPPLARLAGVIIEAINPKGVIQIYIKSKNKVKIVGTLISPPDLNKIGAQKGRVKTVVDGVESWLNLGSLSISQIVSPSIKIRIGNEDYSVQGGELGVIIDLRQTNTNE